MEIISFIAGLFAKRRRVEFYVSFWEKRGCKWKNS
jgi:hypothetical protein